MSGSGTGAVINRRIRLLSRLLIICGLSGLSLAQGIGPSEVARPLSATERTTKNLKAYHDGSIRDIETIGTRDVGCFHGLGSRYSIEEQVEIGRSYADKIEAAYKVIREPAVAKYITGLGQLLASNSDTHAPFSFTILSTHNLNAFALPGGAVYVDAGLILAAESEPELAAVLSHEIAHVAACHAAQQMRRTAMAHADSSLLLRMVSHRMGSSTVYQSPAGEFEQEADLLGAEYLYKAGYDPGALPSYLAKVGALHEEGCVGCKDTDSHRQLIHRIKTTRRETGRILPPASVYRGDSLEFQQMKVRLFQVVRDSPVDETSGVR